MGGRASSDNACSAALSPRPSRGRGEAGGLLPPAGPQGSGAGSLRRSPSAAQGGQLWASPSPSSRGLLRQVDGPPSQRTDSAMLGLATHATNGAAVGGEEDEEEEDEPVPPRFGRANASGSPRFAAIRKKKPDAPPRLQGRADVGTSEALADGGKEGAEQGGGALAGSGQAEGDGVKEPSIPAEGTALGPDGQPLPPAPPHRRVDKSVIPLEGKSLFLFDTDVPLRRRAYNLVNRKWFNNMMFALILANCVAMALEHPGVVPGSPMGLFLYWSDIAFTACFTIEMAVKIFAWSFTLYIRKLVNQVDCVIVASSVLEIVLDVVASGQSWIHVLRMLRVLKPLRTLTRSRGMQLVFKSLTMSLAAMAHVSLVLLIFFLIFAILGTQLFMGRLYSCNDSSVANEGQCVGTFLDDGLAQNRTWTNQFPNFDNVGNALLICIITSSLNGYTDTMHATMNSPANKGDQPREGLNPFAFFWFLGFGVVVSFTLLNLYVGVIFSQFSKIRLASQTGSAFLTSEQQEWAELSKMVFRLKPADKLWVPENRVRRAMFHIINHRAFDYTIMGVICTNIVAMSLVWWMEPQSVIDAMAKANIVFTAAYAVEATMKIVALGWSSYWKNSWNKFDLVLAVIGLGDLILSYAHTGGSAMLNLQKLLRLARIARMIKLMKSASGIKHMINTLIAALPAFGNVGALLALFFFMYAYLGVWMLGSLVHIDNINKWANFSNFLYATLTLFRVATGDNWADVLAGSMVRPPLCSLAAGNCGTYGAVPYLLSFYLLIPVIMLNLFTAVIIETFDKENEQDAWKLSPQALDTYVNLWSEYDDGTGTISTRDLELLLLRLDPPLGLGPYADDKDVLRFVYDLDIPLVGGRVPFHKTAFELVKRCSLANIPEGAVKEQIDALVERFFRDLQHDETMNFSVAVVVQKVQRKWRARMRAARLKRKLQWRASRAVDVPTYSEIWHQRDTALERLQLLKKEVERGSQASRWKLNPAYSSLAADEAAEQTTTTTTATGRVFQTLSKAFQNLQAHNVLGGTQPAPLLPLV